MSEKKNMMEKMMYPIALTSIAWTKEFDFRFFPFSLRKKKIEHTGC